MLRLEGHATAGASAGRRQDSWLAALAARLTANRILASAAAALALMLVQVAAIRLSPSDVPVRLLLPATLAAVPLALWPHRRYAGVWVVFVGVVANLAAIVGNGGLMPIERSTVVEAVGERRAAAYQPGEWIEGSKDVLVPTNGGRLTALGDGIVVRLGGSGIVASPGDVVIAAGLLILVAEAAARSVRRGTAQRDHHSTGVGRRLTAER